MPKHFVEARVKQDWQFDTVIAFSGHEYVKSEWRPVPLGSEKEAQAHPYLEWRLAPLAEEPVSTETPEVEETQPAEAEVAPAEEEPATEEVEPIRENEPEGKRPRRPRKSGK